MRKQKAGQTKKEEADEEGGWRRRRSRRGKGTLLPQRMRGTFSMTRKTLLRQFGTF